MPTIWIVSITALWLLVLFETGVLLLLLRALGEIRQQVRQSSATHTSSPATGGLAIGEKAPAFTTVKQDGSVMNLDDFQGRKRVLAFILPGCPACRGAITALNMLVQEEHDLEVLVVGGPDRAVNGAYALEQQMHMPLLTPAIATLSQDAYGIPGVPFVFVLDERGIVRAKRVVNLQEHMRALLSVAFPPMTVTR